MGINGIEENPYALVQPANTNITKRDYEKLIQIKKRLGCANDNMSEFIRAKIILPYIHSKAKKYNL